MKEGGLGRTWEQLTLVSRRPLLTLKGRREFDLAVDSRTEIWMSGNLFDIPPLNLLRNFW